VLELHGSAGRGHRGRDQRRDVAGAEESSSRASRHSGAADKGNAARCGPACGSAAGGRAGAAREPEHLSQKAQRAHRRRERRQPAVDAAQLPAEAAAAGAVPHVAAGIGVRAKAAFIRLDELLVDLAAGGVARRSGLRERDPRADEERLDGADRDPERRRQLGVGHTAQLAQQKRGSLLIGEPADVVDQPPQRLAGISLGNRVVDDATDQLEHLRRGRCRPPELVDAAVVSHAKQPRAQREISVAGAQPRVRAHEHILERILRVLPCGQHLPRVREQALVVAVVDRAEGLVVAGTEQRNELFVGAEAKQRRRD
jgi:hypothetical protein